MAVDFFCCHNLGTFWWQNDDKFIAKSLGDKITAREDTFPSSARLK